MVGDAWLEAGVVLGLAILSSVLAYGKSSARSDAKFEELERIIEERRNQVNKELVDRNVYVDKEFRELRYQWTRDTTELKTLMGEFRQSIATLYNDKADIRVDVALNYLSKPDFYAALERTSLQINAHQVNMEARFARIEERIK